MTSLICLVKAAWAKSGRRPTRSSTAVALKILPDAFAADPDRLARFTREAQILASLNHPNIAAIYGIEEAEGTRALVLELVEGPTLADRISQGPIPLDEALPIARQIAEALEAAHEAGVIHRDLKPANIKVREDGTVKVLDFGLAKALDTHPQGDPSESPTLTAAATQMGVIMGTAAYMSPEQAKGKAVDKRADVWAFGVVLYEMLTGTRPFVGDVSETLARVIDRDPDWNVLPHSVPPVLRNVLRQCLQKSPKKRVRDIGDVQLAMDGAFEMPVIDARAEQSRSENGWRGVVPWVAVVCLLVGGLAGMLISRPATDSAPAPRVARRFSVPPQTSGQWLAQFPSFAAVSPNGSDVVYTANGRLYHHSLEAGKSGDLLADLGIAPFFSPDGEWVAYWSEGGLRKVRLAGGAPLAVCACDGQTSSVVAGIWGPDDAIVFGGSSNFLSGLFRVPASGGEPQPLTTVREGERLHLFPQALPDGRGVLFTVVYQDAGQPSRIAIQLFDDDERRMVVEGSKAYLTSTGHLVYGGPRGDTIWAVAFDSDTLETKGEAALMFEGLRSFYSTPFFALGGDGTLAYLNREVTEASHLVWVDRQGQEEPLPAAPNPYFLPKISPNGQRIVVELREPNDFDLWVYSIASETLEPLAAEPQTEMYPLWTPDGQHVVYSARTDDGWGIFRRSSYGTGRPELMSQSESARHALGWSGQTLILAEVVPSPMLLGLDPGQEQADLLLQEDGPFRAAVSPDGEWIAYNSNQSGTFVTWVRPMSGIDGRRLRVSQDGGTSPAWSPDGSELFYRNGEAMMAASFDADTFSIVDRQTLFEGEYLTTNGRNYDVAPSGDRFLMVKSRATPGMRSSGDDLHLVTDWFEELKARVPVN